MRNKFIFPALMGIIFISLVSIYGTGALNDSQNLQPISNIIVNASESNNSTNSILTSSLQTNLSAINTTLAIVPLSCGGTITSNTLLISDLLNCPGNGIVMGAVDVDITPITLDCQGHKINGTGTGFGVSSTNRQNINVKNCIIQNFNTGIYFVSTNLSQMINNTLLNNFRGAHIISSSNDLIINNTVNLNSDGIILEFASINNILRSNDVSSNSFQGISTYSSSNNIIEANIIKFNGGSGVYIPSSSFTTIKNNIIQSNQNGISSDSNSQNNLIYNNYFNNTISNVGFFSNLQNRWNITKTLGTNIAGGLYLGGNFWSDYIGIDNNGDGIGDTKIPYNSSNNIVNGGDFLPLILVQQLNITCVQPPSNMISWWSGDGNANDIQDGNHGTLQNGVTFATGKVGQAFSFDGVDDSITIADSPSFDISSFTLDAWVNTANAGIGRRRIISQQLTSSICAGGVNNGLQCTTNADCAGGGGTCVINNQYWLIALNNNVLELGSSKDGILTTKGLILNDSVWHHVAVVRNAGSFVYWYVDGVQIGSQIISNVDTYSLAAPVSIGFNPILGEYFNGLIDEVELFNRALSGSEIQAIYNAGSAGKCKVPVIPFSFIWNVTAFVGSPEADPDQLSECSLSGFGNVNDTDYDKLITNLTRACNSSIVGIKSMSITFGSNTYNGNPNSDIFITDKNAQIYAWIARGNGFELHASKKAAEVLTHPFDYEVIARGTFSPYQFFNYTITARGKEQFLDKKTVSFSLTETMPGTLKKKCESRPVSRPVTTGYKYVSSPQKKSSDMKGDGSITSESISDNKEHFIVELNVCNRGYWIKGWISATYELKEEGIQTRKWERNQSGDGGFVVNGDENKNITIYTAGFGSGGLDTLTNSTELKNGVTYDPKPDNLNVQLTMNYDTDELNAITVYTEPWSNTKNGSGDINESESVKNITKHNVTAPNNDTHFRAVISVNCTGCSQSSIYDDANGDGIVEAGQFIAWTDGFDNVSGPIGNILFTAINANPPAGFIDSINPSNVSIFGQDINFTGHGKPSNDTIDYWWKSHKVGRIGSLAYFSTRFLPPANPHHISFNVYSKTGLWSPESKNSTGNIIVNKPPTAFLRYIKGSLDNTGQIIALIGESVEFNGQGFDTDGFIKGQKWFIDGQQFSNQSVFTHTFNSTGLGVHTITFLVQDNAGTWSKNVSKQITIIRYPVLLVHDYLRSPKEMEKMKDALEQDNYSVFTVDLRKPVDFGYDFVIPLKSPEMQTLGYVYAVLQQVRELNSDIKELKALSGSTSVSSVEKKNKLRQTISNLKSTLQLISYKVKDQPGLTAAIKNFITILDKVKMYLDLDQTDQILNLVDSDHFWEDLWKTIIDNYKFHMTVVLSEEIKITDIVVPVPLPDKVKPIIKALIEGKVINIPGQVTLFSKDFSYHKDPITISTGFSLVLKDVKPIFEGTTSKLKGTLYISQINFDLDPPGGAPASPANLWEKEIGKEIVGGISTGELFWGPNNILIEGKRFPKVVIDPGHGWPAMGRQTSGKTGTAGEGDAAHDIGFWLGDFLRAEGYTVIETDPTTDVDARAADANAKDADFYVSIHFNGNNNNLANGVEVFYGEVDNYNYPSGGGLGTKENDKELCKELIGRVAKILNSTIRKANDNDGKKDGVIRDTDSNEGSLAVLRKTKMPACLVEMEFLTLGFAYPGFDFNHKAYLSMAELVKSTDYQRAAARALFNGIQAYSLSKGLVTTVPPQSQQLVKNASSQGSAQQYPPYPPSSSDPKDYPYLKVNLKLSSSLVGLKLDNQDIKSSAKVIGEKIDEIKKQTGVNKVDIIGSGKGGLVAQHYGNYGSNFDVRKIILIGTPLHGADLAKYGPIAIKSAITALVSSGGLPPIIADIANAIVDVILGDAIKQMEPHSTFIETLNLNGIDTSPEWALYKWSPSRPDTLSSNIQYLAIQGVGPAIGDLSLPLTLTTLKLTDPIFGKTYGVLFVWFGDLWTNTVSGKIYPDDDKNVKVTGLGTFHWFLTKDNGVINMVKDFLTHSPGFRNGILANETEINVNETVNGTAYELIGPFSDTVNNSQTKLHNFTLDELAEDVSVKLNFRSIDAFFNASIDDYEDCANNIDLSLVTPNQTVIDYSSANNSTIVFLKTEDTIMYAINITQSGNWALVVKGTNVTCPQGAKYDASVAFKTRLFVGLSLGNATYSYEPGDNVTIFGYVAYKGVPLAGANVTADISRFANFSLENATPILASIKLFDDGLHNDSNASDGLYANKFVTSSEFEDMHVVTLVASVNTSLVNKSGVIVNRKAFDTFFVELLPELTLNSSDITFSNSTPNVGDSVTISAVIHNIKKGIANNTEIDFRDGNETIGFDVVNITGLGQKTAQVNWNANFGNRTIKVIISPFNAFQEKNYFNNNASKQLLVGDNIPPVAVAGPNITARKGDPVFFDGSKSYDNDRIVSYEWDSDVSSGASVDVIDVYNSIRGYNQTGVYTVKLTVRDQAGNAGIDYLNVNVTVVDDYDLEEPAPDAGSRQDVLLRQPVQFDGSISSDNYGIASHTWDIDTSWDSDGDSIPDNDVDLITKYPRLETGYYTPGVYTVKLTVDDVAGDGPVEAFTKITVRDPDTVTCIGDLDCDGVFDEKDNCLNVSNPNQLDYDKDGIGDECWCTFKVAGFGDIDGTIASSQAGNVTCLSSNGNQNVNIVRSDITFDCLGFTLAGNNTGDGIKIAAGVTNTTVQNCVVEEHFNGINAQGNNNKLRNNVVQTNTGNGIFITGFGGQVIDNQVCDNGIDISSIGGYTGNYNSCNITSSWNDLGTLGGCSFACHTCTIPTDNMNIISNTVLCPGTYTLPNGINIANSSVKVKCDNTVLVGDHSTNGIDIIGLTNVKIKDCEVRNYIIGLNFQNSAFSEAVDNKILENTDGIYIKTPPTSQSSLTQTAVVTNNRIYNNIINNNLRFGIFLVTSPSNEILGNTMLNNRNASVVLDGSTATKISNNIMTNGLILSSSSNNNVFNNDMSFANNEYVVNISGGSGNQFTRNEIHESSIYGFAVSSSNNNVFINNNVHDLSIGYLFKSSNGDQIKGGNIAKNNIGIRVFNSINIQISGIDASSSSLNSIHLNSSSNILIYNNTLNDIYIENSLLNNITKNRGHIELDNSTSNNILDNNANGSIYGIIIGSSFKNSIMGNNFTNNEVGIIIVNSSNNTIKNNNVGNNTIGIFINYSNGNLIYNNIFNNTINAQSDGNNFWNISKTLGTNIVKGPNLGGNFWSDYTGIDTDNDGLGNTNLPYNKNITTGGDFLPLTIIGNIIAPNPPLPEPNVTKKNRFISFIPTNPLKQTALRIKLTSLHHPVPPYTGGNISNFSLYEGQYRWVGPPAVYRESQSDNRTFKAATLQCGPYYTDWGNISLLNIYGAEIVPSSIYDVQAIETGCNTNSPACYSPSLNIGTSRWGDVVNPFNPPSPSTQPDFADISAITNKFKSLTGAPLKVQAKLQPKIINLTINVNFADISADVNAFKGFPYPYKIDTSCNSISSINGILNVNTITKTNV